MKGRKWKEILSVISWGSGSYISKDFGLCLDPNLKSPVGQFFVCLFAFYRTSHDLGLLDFFLIITFRLNIYGKNTNY